MRKAPAPSRTATGDGARRKVRLTDRATKQAVREGLRSAGTSGHAIAWDILTHLFAGRRSQGRHRQPQAFGPVSPIRLER